MGANIMNTKTVARDDWLKSRIALLAEEKAFQKSRDALAAKRRALPRYRIDKPYTFQSERGPLTLPQLFGERSQLIVYHFMYGADWQQGCKSCSFWSDNYDGIIPHLNARDVTLLCVSVAPLATLLAFRQRMGWRFDWVSSEGTSFNKDFGVSGGPGENLVYNYDKPKQDAGELPGLSVFTREGTDVFHTYSCYARGLDNLNAAYQFLDLVPKGRDEDSLPWPMSWVKHHDKYWEATHD
jgi:predicted dithiol-disulfide oxidoreductase (DUF899 family)